MRDRLQGVRHWMWLRTLPHRRRLRERFGDARYSRPARADIDRKLERYLPARGLFVEAGANDGFLQSNTYYLERIKKWRGVLIEPIPQLYRECVRKRPRSRVFNCALVAPDYAEPTIRLTYGHLMSIVSDTIRPDDPKTGSHIEAAQGYYNITPYEIAVPARTLSSVLAEAGVQEIDFLSLDVEGYELPALRGLDLGRHRPRFILVEAWSAERLDPIAAYLHGGGYRQLAHLDTNDYLFGLLPTDLAGGGGGTTAALPR